ncbi:competence protein CoiA family protein [Staphylococcus lloydii]|uniref:competence protein CoiA n=1 Tax=Staphylococcus lloydii TaxID=2781774 RepID=UPI002927F957|nr:competence protein CoiA family protein [Staphylococcus lloydii]MDU9417280.1 competence protein CoiA family protein [Staphylococcus lloydii]
MLYGKNKQGTVVHAANASKDCNYYCPLCCQKLMLKRGKYKCAHFAHHEINCTYKEESYIHYQAKYRLGQSSKDLGMTVQIEPYLKECHQIPDILINNKIILEIQCSPITVQQLQTRTSAYNNLGYIVIWIIKDTFKDKSVLSLNAFQSACINPHKQQLFLWNMHKSRLYSFKHLIALGGNRFIGEQTDDGLTEIFNADKIRKVVYRLSRACGMKFLTQCRRKRSVLEPNLSVMYNLKLSDDWVCENLNFIFPEQIFLKTHPMSWQLQLFNLLKQNNYSIEIFKDTINFRQFAQPNIDYTVHVNNLVQQFKRQFANFSSNDVQK